MVDLRNYRSTIKYAVARERHFDVNWTWNIKAINKNIAKIGWGYFDYLGETAACFTVEVFEEEDGDYTVLGTMPDGFKVYSFVGEKQWCDDRTIEAGIESVIWKLAYNAHNVY